jgi:tetratricopeptide (TPR) repeat protein
MNLAHLSVGDNKHELAINLYENVLEKFRPGDLTTQMYLAKAYFWKGDYEKSRDISVRLLARHPYHIGLKFNLAMSLYELAHKILV